MVGRAAGVVVSSTAARIGFIGLGRMGQPMVRRLLTAGHQVVGHTRTPRTAEALIHAGMRWAADAQEVARSSQVILTALPTEAAASQVAADLVEAAEAGTVLIEVSTVSPELARRVAEQGRERGLEYLDAPVSGGPARAEDGTLTVMVGGDASVLSDVQEVLATFGDMIHLCGPVGSGQAVKLLNQLLVGVHTAAAAEAAALGSHLGVDLDAFLEVVGSSFGASAMLARNVPRIVTGDYAAATPTSILTKDLGLVRSAAGSRQVPLRLGAVVEQLFVEAEACGFSDEDMAGIVRLWRDAPGKTQST